MGWFRRRKRRDAEEAARPEVPAQPVPEPDPGISTRQALAAEASPVPEASDRIPWRRFEGGVYARLLGPLAEDRAVGTLLDHCELGSQWQPATRELADQAGPALNRLVGKEDPATPESAEFVAGIIKALTLLPAEDAVPPLVRLATQQSGLTAESMPLARAAVRALGTVPGELVPPALHQLASESPLAALRKAAYAELKRRLRTLSDAPEWSVDTFGLDQESRLRVEVGPDHVAVLRVETGGRVKVAYHESRGRAAGDGRALAGKPTAATVDQEAMREVTELAGKVRAAVRAARTRLESAQKEQREIPTEDWIAHYITHPVLGPLARTLLWELRDGDAWHPGLSRQVEDRWCLVTPDNERRVPQEQGRASTQADLVERSSSPTTAPHSPRCPATPSPPPTGSPSPPPDDRSPADRAGRRGTGCRRSPPSARPSASASRRPCRSPVP
jgi:Domain of unknown function (DUF4132)